MIEYLHTTPRLTITSPEAGSGKSRVLEILQLLTADPLLSLCASASAIFRTLAQQQITLLFDEVDAVFKYKGKDEGNEDLRALLNAGYRRGATIPRCVGPRHEVMHFPVYAAAALAGIGELPETIMTRSVIIRMRKRAPNEPVAPFRPREHESQGRSLGLALATWANVVGEIVGDAWPKLPDGISDRPAEIWEPLIAVADAADGHWPETARKACVPLCKQALDRRMSLGVRLLGDLRTIFGDAIALHTETILRRLCDGEASGLDADAPWADLHGSPINSRRLASLLKPYDVTSIKVNIAGDHRQGYRRDRLHDAWSRYLSAPSPNATEPPEPAQDSAPVGSRGSGSSASFEERALIAKNGGGL